MASNDPPSYPAPNEWPPYRSREDDHQWTRQYLHARWNGPSERVLHESAMRELHADLREIRDVHDVLMRVQRRYESALVEQQRMQQELAYYRDLANRQQRELARPSPARIDHVSNIRIMTAEEQEAAARMPVYQMGMDFGHSRDVAVMMRLQAQAAQAVTQAFGVPPDLLKEKPKAEAIIEEKKPDTTGRIIDLES